MKSEDGKLSRLQALEEKHCFTLPCTPSPHFWWQEELRRTPDHHPLYADIQVIYMEVAGAGHKFSDARLEEAFLAVQLASLGASGC